MKRSLSPQSGFTLLEIMLVVMIIALIIGGAIKVLGPQLDIGKETRIQGDIGGIQSSLMVYESLTGSLPTTDQGLNALVNQPEGLRKWRKTMDAVPVDPYSPRQEPYRYQCPGKHNPTGYDLYSIGKDKTPDTADDIGNWNL